ncbi:hypothetical protein GQ600_3981 [Phytophthora cactorum]|nr:hypothetical protein GQ600_3981 [Phytophthora cactorum]
MDDLNTNRRGEQDYQMLDSGDESEEEDLSDLDVSDSETSSSEAIDEDGDELFDNEERHFADHFLESMGGEDRVHAGETPYAPIPDPNEYPDLLKRRHGPTTAALKSGDSPISLYFLFMPVSMWQHIAGCRRFYMDQRVEAYFEKKGEREQKAKASGRYVAAKKAKARQDVRQKVLSVKPIQPHGHCVYNGLLIAPTIMPNREKLASHWRQDDVGAIPRGSFGQFMARDRFMDSSRNPHINSNHDPRVTIDRAWKSDRW